MGSICSSDQHVVQEIPTSIRAVEKNEPQFIRNDKLNDRQEYECAIWCPFLFKWQKRKLQIKLTTDDEFHCLLNGKSVTLNEVREFQASPQVFRKLEQLKYFEYWGNGRQKLKKVQQFAVNWRLQKLIEIGGCYTENELKVGFWKELNQNYWTKIQIFEVGQYFNNLRVGRWGLIMNDQRIGGGQYNQSGQKHGKWREINDESTDQFLIIQDGEYQNGKRVGIWEILLRTHESNQFKKIAGGQYVDNGEIDSIKNGKWFELGAGFSYYSQCILDGSYKKGKKMGQWNLIYGKMLIGGGKYDEVNGLCEIKNGRWIEQIEEYNFEREIIYDGEYRNNQKIGKWEIFSKLGANETFKLVGGGTYNYEKGQGSVKNGKWTELNDKFRSVCQITYNGEYRNNNKIGRWDTFYCDYEKNIKIGGGSYCDTNFSKIGSWIELSEDFRDISQVTYCGNYQNNNKVGRWDIFYNNCYENIKDQIGGGSYLEVKGLDSTKNGKWIEISPSFNFYKQAIVQGEYNNGQKIGQWEKFLKLNNIFQLCGCANFDLQGTKIYKSDKNSPFIFSGEFRNRKKVGRWDTFYRQYTQNPYLLIGGGEYQEVDEDNSRKIGMWAELNEGFYGQAQVIYNGEYKNGNKIGIWVISYRKNEVEKFKQIGGGMYVEMEKLGSVKFGNWIDLSERFYNGSQVIYKGDYLDGNKIGRWNSLYRRDEQDKFEMIGGGQYDVIKEIGSIKIGSWIELSDGFFCEAQLIYSGEYENNNKIGRWDISYRMNGLKFEKIGGGSYSLAQGLHSIKIGKWIELSDGFFSKSQVLLEGNYVNGNKFGKWNILFRKEIKEQFHLIGGGSFDLIEELGSIKDGKWVELSDNYGNGIGLSEVIQVGQYRNGQKVGVWVGK
ncbi:unnamed protein product [Paramecium octaurelia]|uniref:Uncharacterized protein n=1 Tax=Paramecium octaurelia TaxID=43137 RepID=A0A8S1S968_PAROT|nr:unnamed protein product [Paramecium octaurelia]